MANHEQFGSMPFGAEITEAGVRFRIFAPLMERMLLQIDGIAQPLTLHALGDGWHEMVTTAASAGSRYRYLLPDGSLVPDPASRFQPQDIAGPCEVIDPSFAWTDTEWHGRPWSEAVLYELHTGAFTPEGTFSAAATKLDYLQQLGVTAIAMMTLTDFPGNRNWGYDGVLPYAPDSAYGRPEHLKAFLNAAHARGIAVVLDVVYNHFGPEGNFIARYFPQMFSATHDTAWGKGMNFDGDGSREVRDYFIENALFWLREYHADGLRLDASHMMKDSSAKHILDEMAERIRAAFPQREVYLILEDQENVAQRLMRTPDGSAPYYTAQWNHDMTHLLSAAFGNVCADRDANAEETSRLATMLAHGYVLASSAGEHPDEVPCSVPPNAYVAFTQTHDLIGNRIDAKRLHQLVPEEAVRAVTAILLLLPQTPMLFMGEEWGASALFPFFCDYHYDMADTIVKGRCDFLKTLHHASDDDVRSAPNPQAESTFRSAQLNWDELSRQPYAETLACYRELLRVRRERIAPLLAGLHERCGHTTVHGPARFTIEWKLAGEGSLRLDANLCADRAEDFPEIEGETIWPEGEAAADPVMGPWSVRWIVRRCEQVRS